MRRAQLLILLATALLGIGLFAPCLTIIPAAGEWTGVLRIFKPDFSAPRTISIARGIMQLFELGYFFIGAIILIFSILFPLGKLGVLWTAAWEVAHHLQSERLLRIVEQLGKYSMLDILVIALIIVAIKGLPGGSTVSVGTGFYCFALSVLLSLILPKILRADSKKLLEHPQTNND